MGKMLNVSNHVLKHGFEYETSAFGSRKDPISGNDSYHNGEDIISSKFGTDYIIAFQDGTVEALRNTVSGFDKLNASGNYIYIKHTGLFQTRYLHLKKDSLTVKMGQTVKKGEIIAYMGSTGYSTGNHLHFEIRLNGNPQNPLPYLSGEKGIPTEPYGQQSASEQKNRYNIGDVVDFKGGFHYANSQTDVPTGGERLAGKARITGLAAGKKHPYHLIGEKGGSNVYGWVNEGSFGIGAAAPMGQSGDPLTYKKGDVVKIKSGAKWYNGKAIPSWVMEDTWVVYQDPIGDRVVINLNISKRNNIMSAINTADLIKI